MDGSVRMRLGGDGGGDADVLYREFAYDSEHERSDDPMY
jgi:hypothetical protein